VAHAEADLVVVGAGIVGWLPRARGRGGIFVRNAPSPAATSSLTLASLIADRVERSLR
jgi:hypothetical protein